MPAHPSSSCTAYWDEADWLVPLYILERWCQRDEACMQAKLQALLSACERGEVNYRRSDGKWFDDSVHELYQRRRLLIQRQSFNQWCIKLEGKSPLTNNPAPPAPQAPQTPSWAHEWTIAPSVLPLPHKAPVHFSAGDGATVSAPGATERIDERDKSLEMEEPSEATLRKIGVPSDEIIEAFPVFENTAKNHKWWSKRIGNANRGAQLLLAARVHTGGPNLGQKRFPSWWNPRLLAIYLIEKNHMDPDQVVQILERSFPKFAANAAELIPTKPDQPPIPHRHWWGTP